MSKKSPPLTAKEGFLAGTNYAKLTLTAGGTLVGQGNGAYIYAPVAVDETGDLYDGADWNRFSETVPPDVAVDSSLIKSLGSLWDRMLVVLEATGSILKRARQIIQGTNEKQTLSVTRVNATPTGPGEIWLGNVQNGTGQALLWPPAATKDGTAFEIEDLREFKAGDFLSYGGLEWEIGDTPWTTFQGSVLQANVVLAEGYVYDANDVPALNAVADFVLEGRDIHLGLVVAAILKRAANNLGGKGGAAGKVWGYLSSATNATWRRLLDVLRADADTAAKKADYAAALATGRLQKSVAGITELTLGASEAAYDSIEFTGLKTSDVVVTLPAAPSGMRLVRNLSTGDYALKAKAAGQSDAAAVVLIDGDNQVLHHGGSLAVVGRVAAPTAGTHRTASHVLAAGDIGQWNSFLAQGTGIEISLSGDIGTVGDRIVMACRSAGNYDIDLKWAAGTLKLFSARGIHTLNAAGTAELIGSGGNQRAIFVAVKSGADEWTVREGIWEAG